MHTRPLRRGNYWGLGGVVCRSNSQDWSEGESWPNRSPESKASPLLQLFRLSWFTWAGEAAPKGCGGPAVL